MYRETEQHETERISLMDDVATVIDKMSEGNPGAMQAAMEMISADYSFELLLCDAIGLYGGHLYQFWNDCCQRDLPKLQKVLMKYQRGEFSREYILDCVMQPRGTNIEV